MAVCALLSKSQALSLYPTLVPLSQGRHRFSPRWHATASFPLDASINVYPCSSAVLADTGSPIQSLSLVRFFPRCYYNPRRSRCATTPIYASFKPRLQRTSWTAAYTYTATSNPADFAKWNAISAGRQQIILFNLAKYLV